MSRPFLNAWCVHEENIVRPVVVLSDGHGSRFDFAVLRFLREKSFHSLIMPPDTTVQVSHSCWIKVQIQNSIKNTVKRGRNCLHHSKLLTAKCLWIFLPKFVMFGHLDVIVNAAQRVGISSTGLDVRKMHQDKFEQAAKCMDTKSSQAPLCTPKKSLRSSFSTVVSPLTADSLSNTAKKKFRYGSSKYWPVYVWAVSQVGTCRTAMKKVWETRWYSWTTYHQQSQT